MLSAKMDARVMTLDRKALATDIARQGWHVVPELLTSVDCAALRANYDHDPLYRSTVAMQRHGFGRGEYRYFAYPLPSPIAALRAAFYSPLAQLANEWAALPNCACPCWSKPALATTGMKRIEDALHQRITN